MLELGPDHEPAATPLSSRQEELLDALESLATAEPFSALGVGEIAARLGCSRSTLYAIAPSKEQLFLRIVDRVFRRVEAAAVDGAARRRTPATRLSAYLESAITEIRQIGVAFLPEVQRSAAARQRLAVFQRTLVGQMTEHIEAGIESGDFAPVDPVLAAELLDAAASRMQDPRVLADTGLSASEAFAQAFRLVTRGLVK